MTAGFGSPVALLLAQPSSAQDGDSVFVLASGESREQAEGRHRRRLLRRLMHRSNRHA